MRYLPFFLLLLCGCADDFLEKEPIIGTTEETYYRTAEDAVAAVNSAYAALQFQLTPGAHFRWFWGDIMSDDSTKGGSGDNDGLELKRLEEFEGPTNTDLLESEWTANYEGIYRTNVVLERVPAIEMDAALKARVLAEAKFLRAWFYYNQVTIFGGVSLLDRTLTPSEYAQARAEASEVWALIENDLQTAIADLPERSEYAESEIGRATKGAARSLLAKAYAYQQNYSGMLEQAEAVINSGEYSLDADYAELWTVGGENGPGSIFEIQFMTESGGNWGYNNNNEGSFSNVFQRPRGQFEGFGFNLPTQDFVDEFFAEGFEDPRLQYTVFRIGDQAGDRGIISPETTGFPHEYYPRKFYSNKSEEASFGDPSPNGGTNDRVIRYADVLLLAAEGAYYAGDEAKARAYVNEVRARARRNAGDDVLPDINKNGSALLDAIFRERRIELGLEGHRFFDLVRSGRAADALGPLGYRADVHHIFPIPASQIQASSGLLTQNPGY